LPNSYSNQYDYNNALYQFQSAFHVFTLIPICLDFYVLDLHVYLTHERHQIPSDRPHKLDDVGALSPFSAVTASEVNYVMRQLKTAGIPIP
jgi:hypothetical protein